MIEFMYPLDGDPRPTGKVKVLLLTAGGIATIGHWDDTGFLLGWLPLPKRNRVREDKIMQATIAKRNTK